MDYVNSDVWVTWDQESRLFKARLLTHVDGPWAGRPVLWNGWVCPLFTRAVADQIARINDAVAREHGPDSVSTFRWYGDVLVERWHLGQIDGPLPEWPADLDEVERLKAASDDFPFETHRPTAEGRYGVGAFSWTWEEAEPCPVSPDDGTCLHGVEPEACFPHAEHADASNHDVFPEYGPGGVDRYAADEIATARA